MTRTDLEAVRESAVPVETIRLTPVRARVPDHDAAFVWSFSDPVTLSLVNVYRLNPPGGLLTPRGPELRQVYAALLTGEGFIGERATDFIDHYLYGHHTEGVAVETWSVLTGNGTRPSWWYVLLPVLVRLPLGVDDWPLEEEPPITVRTAGEVHPNEAHTFAAPRPYPGPERPLDAGTYVRQAVTRVPPPPAPLRPITV